MAERPRVLIAGGSGVFGHLLARELLRTTSVDLIVAGRRLQSAIAACRRLGAPDRTSAMALDVGDPNSLTRAARDCVAVACATGPFQELSRELPMMAVRAGAHWVDISDDAAWVVSLLDDRDLDEVAREAGVAVIPGLSTVPAVSGALTHWAYERLPGASRARITLFIGNRNARGAASIASAASSRFRRPTRVDLPFGAAWRTWDAPQTRSCSVVSSASTRSSAWSWNVARPACSWQALACCGLALERERVPEWPTASLQSQGRSVDSGRKADASRSNSGTAANV